MANKIYSTGGSDFLQQLASIFPCLDAWVRHPITNNMAFLHNIIVDLNDNEGWTREQIAEWLECLDIDISRSDQYGTFDNDGIRTDETGA